MSRRKLRCRTRRSRKLLFVSTERQRKFFLLWKGQCKIEIWSLGDHPKNIFQTETSSWPATVNNKRRLNPWTYTQFIPPPRHKGSRGGGRGIEGTPPCSFWYAAVFRTDFAFSGKPLIFSTRWGIFYGWWGCWRPVTAPTMISILAAILDFTKN